MINSSDEAGATQLEVGTGKARRLKKGKTVIAVWSTLTDDWEGSVTLQIATPRSHEQDVWFTKSNLRFTSNRVTEIEGDFHIRAIGSGTLPANLTIELIQ